MCSRTEFRNSQATLVSAVSRLDALTSPGVIISTKPPKELDQLPDDMRQLLGKLN